MSPQDAAALTNAYGQMVTQVRARLIDYATYLWGNLGSWRDTDIDRFVAQIVPRMQAGQATMASLTDGYLARLTGTTAARSTVLSAQALAELRAQTTAADVYRRPAVAMRTALADGKPLDAALAAGAHRLVSLVSTDLQLAKTHQTARTLGGARGVVGTRRVLKGEGNCLMCTVASTQLYSAKWGTDGHRELMPIHPGCDCDQRPVTQAEADAGLIGDNGAIVLEPGLLEQVHAAVQATGVDADRGAREPDYRHLITVHEHGELGPLLTLTGQRFTGPGDLHLL